ncbi:hypothetical protein D9619_009258 [Psilocybe cf. subviscida]|uniref:Uncharacterized protein n=1 Tax=Psilocybe cf. subviscida TaxID=2480587 RepID=A0A8H5BTJ3_9AGAR|nr:hypothetical protein D9619_009258 [Psilocybe cf. subviscida]
MAHLTLMQDTEGIGHIHGTAQFHRPKLLSQYHLEM